MSDLFVTETEQSTVSNFIELFELNLSVIPAISPEFVKSYWTPSGVHMEGNVPTQITFKGNSYTPYPIQLTGISQVVEGAYPRPQLVIANLDKLIGSYTFLFSDIIGAEVTYIRTFAKFLSVGLSSPPLTYYIARKVSHEIGSLTFELRTALDKERAFLPSRQMLKKDFPGLGVNKSVR